jgi:hypothetical protein
MSEKVETDISSQLPVVLLTVNDPTTDDGEIHDMG